MGQSSDELNMRKRRSKRCPYCDQLLMEDEAVCWSCGRQTGVALPEAEAQEAAQATRQKPEGRSKGRPPSAVVIYTGLTLAVILGALILTAFLGRQPRLQAASIRPPDEWQRVTNTDETFTLFLPAGWRLFDSGNNEQRATLERLLAANDVFRDALHPWREVRDVEAIFLAASDPPVAGGPPEELFVVARSTALNRLTYAELISVVEQGNVIVSAAEVEEDYDRRYAYIQLRTPGALACQQQFIHGDEELLLAAFCGRSEEPSNATLQLVRRTFQRLSD